MLIFVKIYLLPLGILGFFQPVFHSYPVQVTRVVDGDSVEVKVGTRIVRCRLKFIDAPELSQKSKKGEIAVGELSRLELKKILSNKRVSARFFTKDIYGRWITEFMIPGHSVNRLMLENGFAQLYGNSSYRSYSEKKAVKKLFNESKINKRGLWKTPYIQPSLYRRKLRRISHQ